MAILKEVSAVASLAMAIGESFSLRRCRYSPQQDAKGRVCIATGIHGDEMTGQLIIYGVAERIAKEPEHLHGIVDLYPMLNPLGLDIGERMVPSDTRLDMNRAFPGSKDGTPLECMCHHILEDMAGADLVLDIHSGTLQKGELYQVRINAADDDGVLAMARGLCPELIWIYPDRSAYNASLTACLMKRGTPALIIVTDESRCKIKQSAKMVVEGIFCRLKEMGLWTGTAGAQPADDIPIIRGREDSFRVACTKPGVYVPEECIGTDIQAGAVLGKIVDALEGAVVEEITSPVSGFVFSQRSYSAVYPGTLIARICRKEQP